MIAKISVDTAESELSKVRMMDRLFPKSALPVAAAEHMFAKLELCSSSYRGHPIIYVL